MSEKSKRHAIFVLSNEAKTRNRTEKQVSELYLAFRKIIIFAQIFGLMPVRGIRDDNINSINFKWFSFQCIHSLIIAFMILVFGILYFAEFIREDNRFSFLVSTIFYLCQVLSYALFIKLSMKWFEFNKTWLSVEKSMEKYTYQPNYKKRFKITTIVIIALATLEHIFSILKSLKAANACPHFDNKPLKTYFGISVTNVFTITSYSIWKAIISEIPVITATFSWNFMDVFIILMSAALAERFKQINKRVESNEMQNQEFWKEIREDYNRLWRLCKTVDSLINNHVTLSFFSNLFFICWQMFNSLKPMPNTLHMIYFFYSFGFLLGRIGTVCAYCCWINDESKEILSILFGISQENYSIEADRLIIQICTTPAVITGSNFFAVTRGLCLQVASAIITFEIILVQLGPSFLETDEVRATRCLA